MQKTDYMVILGTELNFLFFPPHIFIQIWSLKTISGLRRPTKNLSTVLGTILARYVFLPVAGIAVVKAAGTLRFLPQDPLYQYALLIQFALPPAMSIGLSYLVPFFFTFLHNLIAKKITLE